MPKTYDQFVEFLRHRPDCTFLARVPTHCPVALFFSKPGDRANVGYEFATFSEHDPEPLGSWVKALVKKIDQLFPQGAYTGRELLTTLEKHYA